MAAEKPESQQATQYSISDERGNAVSVTYTLNSWSARAWNLDRNEQRDGGYTLTDGVPWGTAEGILTGAPRLTPAANASSAGSLDLGTVRVPGAVYFGAHDPRGPAGLTEGE